MMVFPAVQMGADAFFGFNTAELPGIDPLEQPYLSGRKGPGDIDAEGKAAQLEPLLVILQIAADAGLLLKILPDRFECLPGIGARRKLRSFARR